jgi:dUTPase
VSGFKINETADSSPDEAGFGMTGSRYLEKLSSRTVFVRDLLFAFSKVIRKTDSSTDKAGFGMTGLR